MRTLFLVAALLAAVALCRETPTYCSNSEWYSLPAGTVWSQSSSTAHTWCYSFTMDPGYSSYAYVSLRRRVRFNSSLTTLYFCAKDTLSSISSCTSSNSYYNFYTDTKLSTVYGRIDYDPYGTDKDGYVYFEYKSFTGSSYSAWTGSCPYGNCRNHGACLKNTSCWCDQGWDGCDTSSSLADWIVYLIVVLVLVFVFLPIIIVIICCCCCAACAAGAAAAAAR